MDLRQIESFVAVAEELHFGRAAARVHLSQPALSQQIKRLEQELGFELLTRTQRRVGLTAPGTTFLDHARRVLADVEEMVTVTRRAAAGRTGTLRLGYVGSALFGVVPTVMRAMRTEAPDVQVTLVELRTDEQLAAMRHGRLDAGFVRAPAGAVDDMIITPVLVEPIGIALPAEHPLASRPELALAELAGEPFVMLPRVVEPNSFDLLMAACSAAGFTPDVAQTARSPQTLLGLVASGLGVAFVADSVMTNSARDGVAFVPLEAPAPEIVSALARPADATNPIVDLLADLTMKLWPIDTAGPPAD
ncbi:MAG: LysR substrate-binding domain-containing protein [Actinomycetota bacterium]